MADEPTGTPAPESTPPAESLPGGPWQADIQATFTDPQVAQTVDAFLRSKVQPRMTQLEQTIANSENARQLWDAFQENAPAAYAAITRELYGEEAAQAALETLEQRLNGQPQTPPPAEPVTETPQPAAPAYDPSTMLSPEEVQAWRHEQELRAYDAAIEEITSRPENADIDPNRLHTFVAAADGDFDEAIQRYRADTAQVLIQYGLDPSTATPAQVDRATQIAESEAAGGAPPVVGNDAGGATPSATPTVTDYAAQGLSPQQALHKAIEDAAAQTRRNATAPPISG